MRVLWLAVADARGHLMRAHLCRQAMSAHGVEVDIVTTSIDGARFVAAMGSPATVAFDDWRVEFDDTQALRRGVTHRRALRYIVDPRQMLSDRRQLRQTGYDLFVNDFHPLMLCDRALGGDTPVVHVHGVNLWRSISRPFEETSLRRLDQAVTPLLRRLRDRGDAVITHDPSVDCLVRERAQFRLPPIVPSPRRTRRDVRAELGVGTDAPLVCAYLNPYFREPRLAEQIERACAAVGATLYGVGEGMSHRDGWRSFDPNWVDKVAAADCLIAAPGMGSIGLHRTLGVPLLMLLTDQPEQRANATAVAGPTAVAAEFGTTSELPADELARLVTLRGHRQSWSSVSLWTEALLEICGEVANVAPEFQRTATFPPAGARAPA